MTLIFNLSSYNIVLENESIGLKEIVVAADAEDPAYAVIRKAIKKRKYYKNLIEEFQCNVYIKGGIKLLDAPNKVIGIEVGDMGGQLDSNRQGMIYLSESEAILNFKQPDQYKEIMISSKVSGNDNGFSFNRASEMDFDLYRNTSEFQREIISPIANNALTYYKYKLLGKFYDENGRLINKIEVIQKRKEDPTYSGLIYIIEDLWNIQATELVLTSKSMKLPGMDSLWLKQVHVPVEEPDKWKLFSQTISFKANFFGFELLGDFTGIFKDYNLNPTFEKKYFNNEILIFEEGANEKDLEYWDSIRPVPLTLEESLDYVKKDSLEEIWDSKEYKDSIDQVNNKFKFASLLFGYTYRNSWKRYSFGFSSPLSTIQFNPVQGGLISLNTNFRKSTERNLKYLIISPKIQYGFADKKLRAGATIFYQFNAVNYARIYFAGGREVMQFNSGNPIGPLVSAGYNLFGKKNFMKLYERDFAYLNYGKELRNGLRGTIGVEAAKRNPLKVNTNYSWNKRDEPYEANAPQVAENQDVTIGEHRVYKLTASLRIRFDQKYLTYPNRKYIMGSKYPTIRIEFQKAFSLGDNLASDFSKILLHVYDNDITFGVFGNSDFNVKTGTFFNKKRITVVDYQHFNGNQTFLSNPFKYGNSFLQLPYYEMSTAGSFLQAHYQHHFEGFLLDKIPLIRKLGWSAAMGANLLYTESEKDYTEVYFGIDNIGFKIFRLFRVDVVGSFKKGKFQNVGVVLGIKI